MAAAHRRFTTATLVAAGVGLACACAAVAAPAASLDAVTERVRAVLRHDDGDRDWGAEPPDAEALGRRGEPVEVTVLRGAGHAWVAVDGDGKPIGEQLTLLHVGIEGPAATATECALREGPGDEHACPVPPRALVDCATWSPPVGEARAALREARAALFVRVYEKRYGEGPREEQEDVDDGGVEGGVVGGVAGGTTSDFLAAVRVLEVARHRIRVAEEWAGYASGREAHAYARAAAAAHLLSAAFPRPKEAAAAPPPAAVHAEFSRLLATLPLDRRYWWWVRERMVLMAGALGVPEDRARLEGFLTPQTWGPSGFRTRGNALEALARRTGRDPRCDGTRRLDDAAAVAAWKRPQP